MAGYGDRNMPAPRDLAVGRVEPFPTGPREIHLGPGMGRRRPMLCRGCVGIAADKATRQTQITAGLDKQGGKVATGALPPGQRLPGCLYSLFFTGKVGKSPGDGFIDLVEQWIGLHDGLAQAELVQPVTDSVLITGIDRLQKGEQIHSVHRHIVEGIVNGVVFKEKIERVFHVVLDDHFTGNGEELGRLLEIDHRRRIILRIPMPLHHVVGGRDRQQGRFDMYLRALSGPQQEAMRQQPDSTRKLVFRQVCNLQSAHVDNPLFPSCLLKN